MVVISLSLIVGVIGNGISLLVFASPIGTFRRIVVNKSTGKYKSLPYISTLLSTTLWGFYGLLKPGAMLIITVNGAGSILQLIYVILFIIFAPRDKKIKSIIAVAILNIGFTGIVVAVTLLAIHGSLRITVVGIVCAVITIGMYASPLTALRAVIKTKSVEYMPFFLSLFMFLNAGVWSAYSVLVKDYFIGVPNAVGFVLGSVQLILYTIYREKPKPKKSEEKITAIPNEVGLAQVVIELTTEMKIQDVAAIDIDKLNNNALANGRTLPKPSLTRKLSTIPTLLKTLSLGPYDINYSFSRDKYEVINGVGMIEN